jgi:Gliding motility associated protein GldN
MKKLLFLLLLCAKTALAQTISYEAVVRLPLDALTVEYSIESERENYPLRSLFTYQLDAPSDSETLKNVFFDTWYNLAKAQKLDCYSDSTLSKKMQEKWINYDTVTVCNPSHYEEPMLHIVANEYSTNYIKEYAVLHRFTYNTKTHKTTCELPAFAPILTVIDDRGNFRYKRQMAWIKNDGKTRKKLKPVWSKRANLTLPDLNVPEPDTAQTVWRDCLLAQAKKSELQLLPTLDGGWHLPAEKMDFIGVDTIVTYNPETYEEQIRLDTNRIAIEQITQMRFKMCYFFEQKPFRLSCKIERIGLLHDRKDDKGNYRFTQPIFFIKP